MIGPCNLTITKTTKVFIGPQRLHSLLSFMIQDLQKLNFHLKNHSLKFRDRNMFWRKYCMYLTLFRIWNTFLSYNRCYIFQISQWKTGSFWVRLITVHQNLCQFSLGCGNISSPMQHNCILTDLDSYTDYT